MLEFCLCFNLDDCPVINLSAEVSDVYIILTNVSVYYMMICTISFAHVILGMCGDAK